MPNMVWVMSVGSVHAVLILLLANARVSLSERERLCINLVCAMVAIVHMNKRTSALPTWVAWYRRSVWMGSILWSYSTVKGSYRVVFMSQRWIGHYMVHKIDWVLMLLCGVPLFWSFFCFKICVCIELFFVFLSISINIWVLLSCAMFNTTLKISSNFLVINWFIQFIKVIRVKSTDTLFF